jgi:hypothetical protein
MIKFKRTIFILFVILIHGGSNAQTNVDSFRVANSPTKIAINDVIGDWVTGDSLKAKISFVNEGFDIYIRGLNHGVGNYIFMIEKDSIFVNGTAANWPPYDCTLRLIHRNELEIFFYQYFSKELTNVVYRRQ